MTPAIAPATAAVRESAETLIRFIVGLLTKLFWSLQIYAYSRSGFCCHSTTWNDMVIELYETRSKRTIDTDSRCLDVCTEFEHARKSPSALYSGTSHHLGEAACCISLTGTIKITCVPAPGFELMIRLPPNKVS